MTPGRLIYLTKKWTNGWIRDYLGRNDRKVLTGTRAWRLAGLAIDSGALHKQFELARMFQIAADSRPRYLLEIGLSVAGTFGMWGRVCGSLQRIVGLDLMRPTGIPPKLAKDPGVKILVGDSHSEETVARVREALPEGIDLLFIDGDHSYEGVKRDFDFFSPMVNDGGVIALHDINRDSFVKSGIRTEADSGEVYRFWQEIQKHHACDEIVEDPEQDGYGIGVIRWRRESHKELGMRKSSLCDSQLRSRGSV
jgi:hypothetical protein